MTEGKIMSRVEEMDASFDRRAHANGRTFKQEVEFMLEQNKPLTPEERVAIRYFHSGYDGIQPSMTLDEIREGLM